MTKLKTNTKFGQNLWDLKNLDDLPPAIQKSITRVDRSGANTKMIMELLLLKPEWTINEVLVAVYRKFDTELKRNLVSSTLANLTASRKIIKFQTIPATYGLPNQEPKL